MTTATFDFMAPATGKCVPIEAVHHSLSDRTLGEGIAIFPNNGLYMVHVEPFLERLVKFNKSLKLDRVATHHCTSESTKDSFVRSVLLRSTA